MRDFIFQTFSITEVISQTVKTFAKNVYVRGLSERVLLNLGYSTNFNCNLYKDWTEKLATRPIINIFFNEEKKHTNDLVRKEQTADFKITNKEGEIISVLNFFLPIFPLWFNILNNSAVYHSIDQNMNIQMNIDSNNRLSRHVL